ncbi:MAG: DNA polymerase IV [Actinobacteria bacterium]|jgi:DNA polymerase-4|nr:DNA polymerase IV [Acidimicrobiaceae bacterium]MBP6487617.1 DNA polymerase IV [Ilumatobacteraceae bacterium]NMD25548.1 DNA polymerase IV [Actinomycetota bacterium]MBK9970838.1 DNA polymerase IV [Acidimicrobiaceae bacterium]MBP8210580.1 DNA polymerase IV [Ilumatobacteraceae bacterium]
MRPAAPTVDGRTILHVDMDAFYVSVELRKRPDLRGQPVVVGGTGSRGVIAAASYEARRFGLHSAMPSTRARRLCPHVVFLPGDHELYAQVSAEVHEIFQSVTPFIEPLALDEAFLDVTGALRLFGSGVQIAHHVRDRVWSQLQLRCSVGVAPSKFLAKLASVAAKPRATPQGVVEGAGVWEVRPGEELSFLHPLAVKSLWGVGPATLERLERLGVRTVGDLAQLEEAALVAAVGKAHGGHLHRLAWAIDDRSVEVDRAMRSISHEETFATDRHSHDELLRELVRLSDGVATRLRAQSTGARTLTVKVRFSGFDTITRSITLPSPVATAHGIVAAVEPLLHAIDPSAGVRLLGVSASNFGDVTQQLTLDDLLASAPAAEQEWHAAEETIDAIRTRFGSSAIGPASAVEADGLRLVRRGSQQWGPEHDAT